MGFLPPKSGNLSPFFKKKSIPRCLRQLIIEKKWEVRNGNSAFICVFSICEYLREMYFFLAIDYAVLQLRIMLLHFFYKYYRSYAAQSVNCLLKYSPIEFFQVRSTVIFVELEKLEVRNGKIS